MKTIYEAMAEREAGFLGDIDIIKWAENAICDKGEYAVNTIIINIASLSVDNRNEYERAGELLKKAILQISPNFVLGNEILEMHIKSLFVNRCQDYIDDNVQPYEICKVISGIEQIFNNPNWINGFYDACDWIEPNTTREDVPHLKNIIIKYIESIGA